MLVNQLAAKYAEAILEIAAEKDQEEEFFAQLKSVAKTIDENNELHMFFYNRGINSIAKIETVQKIFAGETNPMVLNFLMLLVDARREELLPAIVQEYQTCQNKAHGIVEAKVTTAKALSEAEQKALAARLSELCKKTVTLKQNIDKSIMGGVVVQIGDKVIDGSVARQLTTLKAALLNNLDVKKIGVTS